MKPIDVAQHYFAAWNQRDPLAIVATFSDGGTYRDPTVPQGVSGPALVAYTSGLFAAFPDLSFELVSAAQVDDHMVAAQWLMCGTNSGPLLGGSPTGGTVALPGADFITMADGKVLSVQGYFDQKTFVEQLGLQAIIQPYAIGPVSFGSATSLQLGRPTKPGAFSLTCILVKSDEEVQQVVDYGQQITMEMAQMGAPACNKLKARDLLNKGVEAYKQSKFDQAIEDFKEAKDLDPKLLTARLYLATAYASQYIPGAPSEENIRNGQQAVQEFQEVLQADPKNLSAIDGIGSILFYIGGGPPYDPKKLEESKAYHEKHIQLKPDDREPYYRVAVIDWTLAYRANKELRTTYNEKARKPLKDQDPLPPALRDQFIENYSKTVQEGIDALHRAIEIRPDYDDAIAYLNLLYRQKADMEATAEARDDDLHQADMLQDKVKEIRQRKLEAPPPKS